MFRGCTATPTPEATTIAILIRKASQCFRGGSVHSRQAQRSVSKRGWVRCEPADSKADYAESDSSGSQSPARSTIADGRRSSGAWGITLVHRRQKLYRTRNSAKDSLFEMLIRSVIFPRLTHAAGTKNSPPSAVASPLTSYGS